MSVMDSILNKFFTELKNKKIHSEIIDRMLKEWETSNMISSQTINEFLEEFYEDEH